MSKEQQFKGTRNRIEELRKQLAREEKQVMVECSHKNSKGKLKIEPIGGSNGTFRCKKCGQEFSMDRIDTKSLLGAAELLNDAIQQIRCYADDSETDLKLVKQLGELAYNLGEAVELYDKTVKAVGKKKNKKKEKRNDDNFGNYGWGGISFGGKK